jgi:hypothetical protein
MLTAIPSKYVNLIPGLNEKFTIYYEEMKMIVAIQIPEYLRILTQKLLTKYSA